MEHTVERSAVGGRQGLKHDCAKPCKKHFYRLSFIEGKISRTAQILQIGNLQASEVLCDVCRLVFNLCPLPVFCISCTSGGDVGGAAGVGWDEPRRQFIFKMARIPLAKEADSKHPCAFLCRLSLQGLFCIPDRATQYFCRSRGHRVRKLLQYKKDQ